jgi:hypothetical protein
MQAQDSILSNNYVRVKSNRDQPPPEQPPGNLTFEKIIGQMPARTGRNHSQMPLSSAEAFFVWNRLTIGLQYMNGIDLHMNLT